MVWPTVKKVLRDCTTENDGQTYCAFRVAAVFVISTGFPTLLGCSIYTVARNGTFDMAAFGTALLTTLSGCGILAGGVALKARTDFPLPAPPSE